MPVRFRFYFIVLWLLPLLAKAQISGVVKDIQSQEPLKHAVVFINNTSLFTETNDRGEFTLNGIAPGFADLSIYKEGYQLFKNSIRIQVDKIYKLNLPLTRQEEKSKAVKAKIDDEYKKNQQWFERGFFGTTQNAASCKIVNLKSISFSRTGDVLGVSASEPIEVENQALGYRITYFLQGFDAGVESVNVQGLIQFDTLSTKDPLQRETWERNRLKAYWGSERHLFKALVEGKWRDQGFDLFDEQGKPLRLDSLVGPGKIPGYYKIGLTGKTKVRYQIEEGTSGIQATDREGQVSWIVPNGAIEVSIDGILFNTRSVEITGRMSVDKLADMLPLNYVPTGTLDAEKLDWKNFALLQEKVYVHTDRDYYYPNENIWFKAYLGYQMPILRDTLSKTIYAELIGPDKKILRTKVFRIKNGVAWGDFKLPDSIASGNYLLRAYTNWMRNYGEQTIFSKLIPILSLNQNVEPGSEPVSMPVSPLSVTIKTGKNMFAKREAVDLDFEVKDGAGRPVKSYLSVSVTDEFSAVPVQGIKCITSKDIFSTGNVAATNKYFDRIEYFMERGLSFKGVVKDEKGNPTPAKLDIVQGKLENLITMETDEQGIFFVTGLNFQDSLSFSFKPTNKKGKFLPSVEILPREIPTIEITDKPLNLKFRADNVSQRIQNTYTPGENVIMLEDVEIKGERINEEYKTGPMKMYGTADYSVSAEQLRGTTAGSNVLVGLQGKVPGLSVIETIEGNGMRRVIVKVRGGSSSLTGNTDPLILVDGVPFPDPNSVIGVSPDQVDHIEVVTHAVTQFGSRGTNGVINIILKRGPVKGGAASQPQVIVKKIPGYNKPRQFFSPDYSGGGGDQNPDFRTTIFWDPTLATEEDGTTNTSFYTADLETRYRIVVEGVSDKGIPFRAESFIEVR